jgi:hypothetical protein
VAKFDRNYTLFIDTGNSTTLEVNNRLTITFDVVRNTMTSPNTGTIVIYNLSADNRASIFKDWRDQDLSRKIVLKAGYGKALSPIMSGTISRCTSVRQGSDYVTTIECFDSGSVYNNLDADGQTYKKGTTYSSIVLDMIRQLGNKGIKRGEIGTIFGEIGRDTSYTDNVVDILKEITGGAFFIENGIAHVLYDNETLNGDIEIINSASGLLGTPVRGQEFVDIELLFEAGYFSGQQVILESQTTREYNGTYKIMSIHHSGMISESAGGKATTRLGLTRRLAIKGRG